MNPELFDDDNRRLLLAVAREAIATRLRGEPEPPLPEACPAELLAPGACFVSLHKAGELRGCIGTLEAREPLLLNVAHNAVNAAFEDSRFAPLQAEELRQVDIEISCLTPAQPIATAAEFVPGAHGIILAQAGRRALFLPQVAPEQGWDRETTLQHLCRKAGLPPNAWQLPGARLSVFTAIVFGEAH